MFSRRAIPQVCRPFTSPRRFRRHGFINRSRCHQFINRCQAFRAATRASAARPLPSARFLTPFQVRCLSDEVRSAIDRAVASSPVVLFMKGTPETPQCGFSRASIQILGMQGVDPDKFTAFNVLEDQELRAGTLTWFPSRKLCSGIGGARHVPVAPCSQASLRWLFWVLGGCTDAEQESRSIQSGLPYPSSTSTRSSLVVATFL